MNKAGQQRKYRILIEVNKLLLPSNDGVKRYLTELLYALHAHGSVIDQRIEIDLYVQGLPPFPLRGQTEASASLPINDSSDSFEQKITSIREVPPTEILLLQIKERLKKALPKGLYRIGKAIYSYSPLRYGARLLGKQLAKRDANRLNSTFTNYDLIHIPLPQNFSYLSSLDHTFLVTVHDLSHRHFPQFHTIDNVSRTEQGMQLLLQKKAAVIAVSEATKKDVIQNYPIRPERVKVVYEAYDQDQFFLTDNSERLKEVLEKYDLPNCPFFLTLSTLEPRKNLTNMMQAFSHLSNAFPTIDIALFVCGKDGWKMDGLREHSLSSGENIYFPGFIAEEDLPVLYSHALALCYVSFYEGFGLPPLEAMACGTTVIYGNNSAMPEVIGEAGLAANPANIEEIKTQMQKVLLDEKLRSSLSKLALNRASTFSRQQMAASTLVLYKEIIDKDQKPG